MGKSVIDELRADGMLDTSVEPAPARISWFDAMEEETERAAKLGEDERILAGRTARFRLLSLAPPPPPQRDRAWPGGKIVANKADALAKLIECKRANGEVLSEALIAAAHAAGLTTRGNSGLSERNPNVPLPPHLSNCRISVYRYM